MVKYKAILVSLLAAISIEATAYDANGDRFCLAQNIYFEAGNQPLAGKMAVANVTLNRVMDEQFPNNICDVVYQTKTWKKSWKGNMIPVRGQCQFSWFCDGKSDEPKDSKTWLEAIRIADTMMYNNHIDITDGALWYHAYYVQPYWSKHLKKVVEIEDHIFYK